MAQIILQPNGKYALYSTICDAFLAQDLTEAEIREEVISTAVAKAKAATELELNTKFGMIKEGEPAYYQFTLSYDEALREHTERELENCDSQLELDPILQDGVNKLTVQQHEYYMAKRKWPEEDREIHRKLFKGVIFCDIAEGSISYTEQ